MDLDYRIKSTDFSLEEISAVRVAKELLTSCKMIEKDARETLLQLNLPKQVAETVERFVRVINADVLHWQCALHEQCVNPIITMLGALDLEKTLEDILSDANIDKGLRFRLACEFSCERHIFEIGQLLTTEEVHRLFGHGLFDILSEESVDLVRFWARAYGNIFRKQIHLRDLSQEVCDRGFRMAFFSCNYASVKYFVERASPEAIDGVMVRCVSPMVNSPYNIFSPTTYCFLFSKMTKDQKRCNMSSMSHLLLRSLIRWPYQRFFLRAARLLTEHLLAMDYFEILAIIFRMAKRKFDYDYDEMLEEFYELGGDHHSQMIISCKHFRYELSYENWLKNKMSTS